MFCPNCGAQIPDDSIFCDKCGYRIGGEISEQQYPADSFPFPNERKKGLQHSIEQLREPTVLCSVSLPSTLYHETENIAASVFISICAGSAPAWSLL